MGCGLTRDRLRFAVGCASRWAARGTDGAGSRFGGFLACRQAARPRSVRQSPRGSARDGYTEAVHSLTSDCSFSTEVSQV